MVEEDPVTTNPAHYRTIFENEFVRVLEYIDRPGDATTPHVHPNSVMVTLSDFQRRLRTDAGEREVDIPAHQVSCRSICANLFNLRDLRSACRQRG